MPRKTNRTFETEREPFPTILRTLLQERNITQKELADNLGVTRQVISLYATGQSTPDIKTFNKMVKYFDVSAGYLLGTEETRTTNITIREICSYTGLSEKSVKWLNTSFSTTEEYCKINPNNIDYILNRVDFGEMKDELNTINALLERETGQNFITFLARYLMHDYKAEAGDFFKIETTDTGKQIKMDKGFIKFGLLQAIMSRAETLEVELREDRLEKELQ